MAMRSLAAGVIGPSRYVSIRGDFSEDVRKEVGDEVSYRDASMLRDKFT